MNISVWWLMLGCILVGAGISAAYFKGLFNGYKQGSDSKDEFIKMTDEEFARQREMTTDSCISVMEELYKDQKTRCIKNCGGRETGSERIDILCNRAYVKHGEKLHYKQLQDAKENPDLCSRCQLATSCQQPEEPVDECPDFKSLCDTCHVVASCPERDDKKVSCDGHVPDEDVKAEKLPPICVRCHRTKAGEECGHYDETLTYCGDFYPPQNATDVEATNKEAAESVKSYSAMDQDAVTTDEPYGDQDENHSIAAGKMASTKKACEESIGHDPKALAGDID